MQQCGQAADMKRVPGKMKKPKRPSGSFGFFMREGGWSYAGCQRLLERRAWRCCNVGQRPQIQRAFFRRSGFFLKRKKSASFDQFLAFRAADPVPQLSDFLVGRRSGCHNNGKGQRVGPVTDIFRGGGYTVDFQKTNLSGREQLVCLSEEGIAESIRSVAVYRHLALNGIEVIGIFFHQRAYRCLTVHDHGLQSLLRARQFMLKGQDLCSPTADIFPGADFPRINVLELVKAHIGHGIVLVDEKDEGFMGDRRYFRFFPLLGLC